MPVSLVDSVFSRCLGAATTTLEGFGEQALASIAKVTGGKYYFAEEAGQLSQIYSSLGSQLGYRFVPFDATIPWSSPGRWSW